MDFFDDRRLTKRRDGMLREYGRIRGELYAMKDLETRRLSDAWNYYKEHGR